MKAVEATTCSGVGTANVVIEVAVVSRILSVTGSDGRVGRTASIIPEVWSLPIEPVKLSSLRPQFC